MCGKAGFFLYSLAYPRAGDGCLTDFPGNNGLSCGREASPEEPGAAPLLWCRRTRPATFLFAAHRAAYAGRDPPRDRRRVSFVSCLLYFLCKYAGILPRQHRSGGKSVRFLPVVPPAGRSLSACFFCPVSDLPEKNEKKFEKN